jgi:hypothetical protein
VSKEYQRLFNDQHLLKRLKNGKFPHFFDDSRIISSLAKNKEVFEKIHTALGFWMNALIPNSIEETNTSFILENMWLAPFNSHLHCPDPKIENILRSLEKLKITTYMPWQHLKSVVEKENLPEKTLKEALRLEYLSLTDIPINQNNRDLLGCCATKWIGTSRCTR